MALHVVVLRSMILVGCNCSSGEKLTRSVSESSLQLMLTTTRRVNANFIVLCCDKSPLVAAAAIVEMIMFSR